MCIEHQLLTIFMSALLLRDQSKRKMGDGGYLQGRCDVLRLIESRILEERESGERRKNKLGKLKVNDFNV